MNEAMFADSIDVKARETKRRLFAPILAPLMESRATTIVISATVAIQCSLTALHVEGWQCPVLSVLGVPCPGCGLSRAVIACVRGDWQYSLAMHAFAPLFLFAAVIVAAATLLPDRQKRSLIIKVEALERRTGITAILLIAFVIYWLIRSTLFSETFIRLIKG